MSIPGVRGGTGRLRVAFVTRALPAYRHPLYRRILRMDAFDFRIFCEDVDVNDPSRKGTPPPPDLPMTVVDSPALRRWCWARSGIPLPSPRLALEVRRYRPDVVVMEGLGNIGTDLACLPDIWLRRVPWVWWTLGDITATRHLLRARLGRPVQGWFARRAGAVIAYSSYAVRVMRDLGVEEHRIVNVRNTLDEQEVLADIERCSPEVEALRAQLELGDAPVAVFCGTVTPGKRLDLLLEAWTRLPRSEPAPVLVVVGDGPALAEAKALAGKLDIADRVRFVGRQKENVSAYMLLGRVAVLPGLGGLAINHAFAHRLPVICGRADGCEEDLVHNEETGIRLGEVTPVTLAEALHSLLSRPAEARRMGENAHRLITQDVTLREFAARVIRGVHIAAGRAGAETDRAR
jgi:glycosyltransferase involved in cell wall biosynthesis